jgi:hypothetical protein
MSSNGLFLSPLGAFFLDRRKRGPKKKGKKERKTKLLLLRLHLTKEII